MQRCRNAAEARENTVYLKLLSLFFNFFLMFLFSAVVLQD